MTFIMKFCQNQHLLLYLNLATFNLLILRLKTLIFGKTNQVQFTTSKSLGKVFSLDLSWQPSFSMFCFYYQCHHKLTLTAAKLTRQTVSSSRSGSKSKYVSNTVLFACACPVRVSSITTERCTST